MGEGYGIACKNCDYQGQFRLGAGMEPLDFSGAISKLHYKKKTWFLHQLTGRKVTEYYYSKELYHCETCSSLKSKLFLGVELENGDTLEVAYNCGTCKEKMTIISEPEFEKMNCPTCKKKTLEVGQRMMWD